MEESILNVLGRKDYVPLQRNDLARHLNCPPERRSEFDKALQRLEQRGRIARIKGNRYIRPRQADLIPGQIQINRQGKGFLQPDDPGLQEIAIPPSATSTAFHGDRVLVRRDVKPKAKPEATPKAVTGAVIRILERRRTQLVGTLQQSRQFLYVIPDDPRIPHDVYVPPARDVGRPARVGDKVVVELKEWQSRHTNPEGEIVEVLGAPDAEGVDMLSVVRQYDLPLRFPKAVLKQARSFGQSVSTAELSGRVDCRGHCVVTIDPQDAKDFDDAFSLQPAGQDRWTLWVHIADVSHYVVPGSALDQEARRRGNSTYLVDRVIPMLPEALSNELCSLKPRVDRLTRAVEFLISSEGRVLRSRFHSAVIHSQQRWSYGEAFAILQRRAKGPAEKMLHAAHQLAQRIRRLRFQKGSLDLDFPESKIRLDDQGRVASIERVENDASHQLIEEFMLLANEAVAKELIRRKRPAIHRVHEEPDARRLQEYREEVLSHGVRCGNLTRREEVQRLLKRLDKLEIGPALKIGFLRSLMRARYAVETLGHYGLAKSDYAHFTSPIRRYADLVVHRALFHNGAGSVANLRETAQHISATERNSADAERDSKDAKLLAHLETQLRSPHPARFEALVIDLRNFGFFVDVPDLLMSGLVHLSSLEDDFYQLDPTRNVLVGQRTRRIIRLGDRVQVRVAKVDRFKKQVDFSLANAHSGTGAKKRNGNARPKSRPATSNDARKHGTPKRPIPPGRRRRT